MIHRQRTRTASKTASRHCEGSGAAIEAVSSFLPPDLRPPGCSCGATPWASAAAAAQQAAAHPAAPGPAQPRARPPSSSPSPHCQSACDCSGAYAAGASWAARRTSAPAAFPAEIPSLPCPAAAPQNWGRAARGIDITGGRDGAGRGTVRERRPSPPAGASRRPRACSRRISPVFLQATSPRPGLAPPRLRAPRHTQMHEGSGPLAPEFAPTSTTTHNHPCLLIGCGSVHLDHACSARGAGGCHSARRQICTYCKAWRSSKEGWENRNWGGHTQESARTGPLVHPVSTAPTSDARISAPSSVTGTLPSQVHLFGKA